MRSGDERTERLRRAVANLRAAGGAPPLDLTPKSAHEALTRQMVTDLASDLAELKARVNAILWLLAGAVAVDVVLRVAGVG